MSVKRIYFFDNCKAILIFLVVFGHLVNIVNTPLTQKIGTAIYFFHIPLFVFCSGYFATFNPSKILSKNFYPYIIFQTIYLVFAIFVTGENRILQYTNPYWILWYLFALAVWRMLLPFIDTKNKINKLKILIFLVIISLVVGFDNVTGYYLSFSRIIVFFPFFALSYYIKQEICFEKLISFFHKKHIKIFSLCVFITLLGIAVIFSVSESFDISWLYGALPYKKWHYSIWMRLWFFITASSAIPFLFSFVTTKKCFLTIIGERSIYIYLIHGFFIKLIIKFNFLSAVPFKALFCFLLAVFMVYILSRSTIVKLFRYLTDFDCAKHLIKRNRT